jgi:hypothetical protein
MRFMLLMKGDPPQPAGQDEAGWDDKFVADLVAAMQAYDAELRKAGVLLAEGGLYPTWNGGVRIAYTGGKGATRVIDGPFSETKELIAGYYLIEVKSREEAIEWAKRCPIEKALPEGQEFEGLEIRQVADVPEVLSEEDATELVKETLQR